MICVVKMENVGDVYPPALEPVGWIIAADMHDARRQAHAAGERALASWLYNKELEPAPGKYKLDRSALGPFGGGDATFWMLVS
jgi:hypothetical protein